MVAEHIHQKPLRPSWLLDGRTVEYLTPMPVPSGPCVTRSKKNSNEYKNGRMVYYERYAVRSTDFKGGWADSAQFTNTTAPVPHFFVEMSRHSRMVRP